MERTGVIEFAGQDAPVIGSDLEVGLPAPEFTAQAMDFSEVNPLRASKGKVLIIGSLPSLNTSVCDRETRRFNEAAATLSDEVAIYMLSMDLPFTLKQWCGAAGIEQVVTLSDHMGAEFGEKYGVLLKNQRILRRAIFVVDRQGKLVYVDYMDKLGSEPDYEAVLAAARQALGG
jgi:thiol peroxidase